MRTFLKKNIGPVYTYFHPQIVHILFSFKNQIKNGNELKILDTLYSKKAINFY